MNRRGILMRACGVALAAGAAAAIGGCASRISRPAPRDLSLANATIVALPAAPTLVVSGLPGGKAGGAGVGAGTGFGAGTLVGAAACLAAGPFAPLCFAAVVPATSAIGTVTGGVVGGIRAESSEAMAAKVAQLTQELGAASHQTAFAQELQAELRNTAALDTSLGDAAAPTAEGADVSPARMIVSVGIVEIGSEGKAEFALRFVTRAQVRRPGEPSPLHEAFKEVQSEAELTLAQWMAQDALALRAVMKRCLREAAHDTALLLTSTATRSSALPKYSTSCNDDKNTLLQAG